MTVVPIVSGVGSTRPVRRSELSAGDLALQAIQAAIADAGLSPHHIDGVVTESMLTPAALPVEVAAATLGVHALGFQALSSPVGAGILGSIGLAHEAVAAGRARHVLVYFATGWGSSAGGPAGFHASMEAKSIAEAPAGYRGPIAYFASMAQRYKVVHKLSEDALSRLLGEVAIAARSNARRHSQAQEQRPLDLDSYLDQPPLVAPLRRADVSLLTDGACAAVVSAAGSVAAERRTVRLSAWAHAALPTTDESFYTQDRDLPHLRSAAIVADKLRAQGASPGTADVLELYDCFTIATVLQLESLGIAGPGGAAELVFGEGLETSGARPTNTHGGLLSHGYFLGAGHVIEAVRQLRHESGAGQVHNASSAFVGAGPGRQYTGLFFRRTDA